MRDFWVQRGILVAQVFPWSSTGGFLRRKSVIFGCHGFVTSLLVFHIITSWTKEKNYVSQRTSRSEKEDTSQQVRHLVAHGLLLSLATRDRSGCASKPCAFIRYGFRFRKLSHSLSLSLSIALLLSLSLISFGLLYLLPIRLYCIVSSCISTS